MSNEKTTNENCVCLKCYALRCTLRSIENKICPKGAEK